MDSTSVSGSLSKTVTHAAFLALLLIVFVLQADWLAAVFAKLRAHKVERAAAMTERFARCERVHLDRGAALFTIRAQVVKTFETSAFALPVTNLVLDEVEGGGAAEVGDRKH
jgi:hypothetical protein